MTSDRYNLNREPRVSHNQLAEYLGASPIRRASITREAKFPKIVPVSRYREARLAIARHVSDSWVVGDRHIREAIQRLKERASAPSASPSTIDDSRLSVAALEAFGSHGKIPDLERHDFRTISGTFPHLMIGGVSVSVAISATVHRIARDGAKSVGGLCLFISKAMTAPEGLSERAAVAALLCYMFAEENLGHLGAADHKLCLVLDVAGGRLYPAPKGQSIRRKNLALAGAEIARAWPTVIPPNDYDGPEL